MSKVDLSNVTLICADGREPEQASSLLAKLSAEYTFCDSKLFSDNLASIKDYNLFIAKELVNHIDSDFCMIIQTDGYPVYPDGWEDCFLDYDYIGAPWYTQPWPREKLVGNGGFSIRSKRFLEEASKIPFDGALGEDVFFCRIKDEELREKGIRFAPHDVAYRFAVEDMPWNGQFGFHGKVTVDINKHFGVWK